MAHAFAADNDDDDDEASKEDGGSFVDGGMFPTAPAA